MLHSLLCPANFFPPLLGACSKARNRATTKLLTAKIDLQMPGQVPHTHFWFPLLAQPSKDFQAAHPVILLAGNSMLLEGINDVRSWYK